MRRHEVHEENAAPRFTPAVTTDDLRSYRAAMTDFGYRQKQDVGRRANNRVENSHLPFRRR